MSELLKSMANERIDLTLTFKNVSELTVINVLEQWLQGLPDWTSSSGKKDGVSYTLVKYDARDAKKKASKEGIKDA